MHELIIWALHFYNFLLLRIKLHAAHIRILMCLYSLIGAAFRTFTCKINLWMIESTKFVKIEHTRNLIIPKMFILELDSDMT